MTPLMTHEPGVTLLIKIILKMTRVILLSKKRHVCQLATRVIILIRPFTAQGRRAARGRLLHRVDGRVGRHDAEGAPRPRGSQTRPAARPQGGNSIEYK